MVLLLGEYRRIRKISRDYRDYYSSTDIVIMCSEYWFLYFNFIDYSNKNFNYFNKNFPYINNKKIKNYTTKSNNQHRQLNTKQSKWCTKKIK